MKTGRDPAVRAHKRYDAKIIGVRTAAVSAHDNHHDGGSAAATPASAPSTKTSAASNGSGEAPTHLTRIISACSRCRSRKTKCDQKFPSCSACLKAGVECVGLDAATGREVPRSYIAHLEDRVAFLEIQLQNQGISIDATDNTLNPQHSNTPGASSDGALPNSLSTPNEPRPKDVDSLVSTVGLVSMKGSSTLSSPSFLGLSSGISFARLMFAAVKLRGQDVPSAALSMASSEQPDMTIRQKPVKIVPAPLPAKEVAETLLEVFFNQANAQIPIFHRDEFIHAYFEPVYGAYSVQTKLANINNVRNDSVSPSSANSPELSARKSPVATTTTVKTEFPADAGDEKPKVNGDKANGGVSHGTAGNADDDSSLNSPEMQRSLYFLNLIFAIGVAVHQQQYPAFLCESYHASAMRYIEPVFASPDRLESLQGLLCLGLYSIMRPAVPGVWYVLGVALRLCVDLGLHVEGGAKTWSGTNIVPKSGQASTRDMDPFDARTLDLRRRLFWCTYAMDRQVCVYLGRPFGIADNSIKVPFPSDLDDVFITSDGITNPPVDTPPSYKQVAVHIFQIRRLQSEIQTILYERAELPRRFATLKEWQTNMARRLEDWNNSAPKSAKDMNCNFNLYFLDLNYHQSKLLLHGISPAIPRPSVEAFFIIADASEKVIRAYRQLHREKNINYTWMAVHNLFMAGTSYLYCLYHSKEVRSRTRMDVIDFNTMACIHVLTAMVDRCDAASGCRDTFELLTAAILRLCYNEKAAAGEIIAPSNAGAAGSAGDGESAKAGRNATPPVPPAMPPPAKRSRRSRLSNSSASILPNSFPSGSQSDAMSSLPKIVTPPAMGQMLPMSQQVFSPMYSVSNMEFNGSLNPVSPSTLMTPSMSTMDPPVVSQADTPQSTTSTTESLRTNGGGLSPFASFESNTLQWMTEMEPDLDEIFRTAAEIQAVPPMHGNFTHPVAYSGNVSGNTQGGGYAYQFSPGTAIQHQYATNGYFNNDGLGSGSPGDSTVSASSVSPSTNGGNPGAQIWSAPRAASYASSSSAAAAATATTLSTGSNSIYPIPNASGASAVQQQHQQMADDEYDGQRIYEMMYELPSASIWDQFFGGANFAQVGPGFAGMLGSNNQNDSPPLNGTPPMVQPSVQPSVQPPQQQQAQQQQGGSGQMNRNSGPGMAFY
ncbi:fungal-specific transcription factor domain-containing protein [Limtongia smithiae]|uniref:fungal-specific transcription factor domain-containing protein n=1 Tax=Limtongia smithiae TaxID=1125753 RepID=UPI0034CFAC49